MKRQKEIKMESKKYELEASISSRALEEFFEKSFKKFSSF